MIHALLIALGFVGIGRFISRTKPTDLFAWNDVFLIGGGVSALLLFPLSLVVPHLAVKVIGFTVLLAVVVQTVLFLRRPRWPFVLSGARRFGVAGGLALALTILAVLFFVYANWRWSYGNDGLLVWTSKAQVLHSQGGLLRESQLWIDAAYLGRYAAYPHLISLYEALVSLPYRQFNFDAAKTPFALFYVSLLLSTFRLGRSVAGTRLGIFATALLAWLPGISAGDSLGGYSDMPMAALVTAAVASLCDGDARSDWRSRTPWLMGSLLMVKSEGSVLLGTMCGVLLLVWLSSGLAAITTRIKESWSAIAVLSIFVTVRLANLKWLAVQDATYRPVTWKNVLLAKPFIGYVANLSLRHLFSFETFGFFWAAFAIFGVVVIIKGSARQRALVAGTILALGAYTATFLFTNWVIAVHIATAYDRIVTHVAPLAAVCIAAGYSLTRPASE